MVEETLTSTFSITSLLVAFFTIMCFRWLVRRFDDAVDHYFARTCAGFLRYIAVLLVWLADLLDGCRSIDIDIDDPQVVLQPPEIDIDVPDDDFDEDAHPDAHDYEPYAGAGHVIDWYEREAIEPPDPLAQPEPEPADTADRDSEMLSYGKYAGRTFAYVFSHDLGYCKWTVDNRRQDSTIALRRFADYCCDKGGFPRRWHEDSGPGYRDYSLPDPR